MSKINQAKYEVLKDSKEKEAKDLKWLKKTINDIIEYHYEYPLISGHTQNMINEIKSVIEQADQLDEPETLSQELLNKRKISTSEIINQGFEMPELGDQPDEEYFINIDWLEDILVPKQEVTVQQALDKLEQQYHIPTNMIVGHLQELYAHNGVVTYGVPEITEEQAIEWVLENARVEKELTFYGNKYLIVEKPLIPHYVAEYFSEFDGNRHRLFDYILMYHSDEDTRYDGVFPINVGNWIFESNENIILALELSLGNLAYEAEEEQEYYILLPKIIRNWKYVSLRGNHNGLIDHYTDNPADLQSFTEQEIKDIDPGYMVFAKPVEELEE